MRVTEARSWLRLFWPKFVEYEDGLFLAHALPSPRPSLSMHQDVTGAEAFYNHLHIFDELEHGASLDGTDPSLGFWDKTHPDFVTACEIGKQVAAMWHAKLMLEYPTRRTRVYFTSEDDPIVRFHCVRADEQVWLDESDWSEDVRAGRIIVLDSASRIVWSTV